MAIRQFTKAVITLTLILLIGGCKKDDPTVDPTAQELAFELLEGAWILGNEGSIIKDQQNITSHYPEFSLSFSEGNYTTTNGGDVFPAADTWSWIGESSSEIELGDGRAITLVEVSLTQLMFSFQHISGGGSANGVDGFYTVTLKR